MMAIPDQPPFNLLPANDPQTDADTALSTAATGAVAPPASQQPVAQTAPLPFGQTWVFDFEAGRFVRQGGAPAVTMGFGALVQWCLMAIHSARSAHPVFSDEFGMEDPDSVIGEFVLGEALADWQTALVDALMVHERITSVENFNLEWDPSTGILTIFSFDVVTDEDERVAISDVTLRAGGAGQ